MSSVAQIVSIFQDPSAYEVLRMKSVLVKKIISLHRNGDRYNIQRVPEVVGESGSLLVHFYSDVAYNMTGFNLTFRYQDQKSQNDLL